LWTALRNFLRPFRGVSKHFLHAYVAIYEFNLNLKAISPSFIAALVHHRALSLIELLSISLLFVIIATVAQPQSRFAGSVGQGAERHSSSRRSSALRPKPNTWKTAPFYDSVFGQVVR
jgi:hypothetical protein